MKLPKCKDCGACCWHGPLWVEVSKKDAEKIPSHLLVIGDVELHAMDTNYTTDGKPVCAALVGELGKKAFCSIYRNRPTICRKVKKGSPICMYMLGLHKINIGLL